MWYVDIKGDCQSPSLDSSTSFHRMMQCNISIRASTLECEACGSRNKRMLSHEYTCMSCGVIDGQVMIVDEMSEQRKQWESNEADTNANKYTLTSTPRPPRPTADKRVLKVAKSASLLFSIESEQIPMEATSMYMATATSNNIAKVRVIACTMITAHRRTARDIEDAALAFSLKAKSVARAIEAVQAQVLTGDKGLGDAFGYLFWTDGDRRTSHLVKDALDQLSACMPSSAVRGVLHPSSWGIRVLADDMMRHIQDCRLIGGNSLDILARALVVMACQFLQVEVETVDYISTAMMQTHRATWALAVTRWPGGPSVFAQHVARKFRLSPGWSVADQTGAIDVRSCSIIRCKRETRALVASELKIVGCVTPPGTALTAGMTHLCVVLVARDERLQSFVSASGIRPLMDVCLSAIQRTTQDEANRSLIALVEAVEGYQNELHLARQFKRPLPNDSVCFMPRELMRWGRARSASARRPSALALRRT